MIIRDYIVHVIAASLFCAVVLRLTAGNGSVRLIMKLLCGIFLVCSIIQPIRQMDFSGFENITSDFYKEADQAVQWGEDITLDAWSESIREGTAAYIFEKAKAMNVDLAVEVELSDDEIPVPFSVSLTGRVAPYVKSVLSDIISQDLNIPKEMQTWISP